MADLTPTPSWDDVPAWNTNTTANGDTMNAPAQALANRTELLRGLVGLVEVSPEMFGYLSGDATQAFKDAALYAKEHNIPLVAKNPNGYPVSDSLEFYTETDISEFILPADGVFRTLSVKSQKAPELIPVSQLSGLTVSSNKVTGFPLSAVGKYIKITSNDVLTERNNAPSNTPYYKNTAFRLIDSTGAISPSLDMSFTAESTGQVAIYPTETRIKLKIGNIATTGNGNNHNSIYIDRDSVDFHLDNVSGSTGFRTLVTLQGNDCNFFSPFIKDAQYEGLGYGISIGICCDTNIYSMKGSNCRTTLDGRHGSNVTIHNSRLETAGTHWGNSYLFKDCDIDTVTWSGKDLKLQGGSLRKFISMRSDVAMCIGNCEIDGTKIHSDTYAITPSDNIIGNFFTSPRRVFDSIIVRNVECTANIASIFGYGTLAVYSADFIPPKYFLFDNIRAINSNTLRLAQLNLANSVEFTEKAVLRANNILAKVVIPLAARGFSKFPSSYGYDVRAVDCGKIFVQCDANTFSRYKLIDSELAAATRINASTALGPLLLDDCVISHGTAVNAVLFNIEAKKGFLGCEYRGVFSNTGAANGETTYSLNCRAATGASGYPPLDWYVNENSYQKQDVSVTYDPSSIPANSAVTTTVSLIGARVGDFVSASFSVYNAGIEIYATISSTNIITVTFKNTTAAPIDLASGTLKVKMI